MRIVFDVTTLAHQRTGVGNYILGTLRGLVGAAAGEHEIVALGPTTRSGKAMIEQALEGLPVERRLPVLPAAHAWRTLWSRAGRPAAERLLGRFDVLQFWDWMYPPQRDGLRATMIHDLVPLRFPQWVTARTRRMHRAKYANAARTCDVVFVNCEYTKRDVVEALGIPAGRVEVAYPGVGEHFRPVGERADLGRRYILTVATLEPRKNLGALLEAHALLGGDLALAVAGSSGWGPQPELERDRVIPLGYVSDHELARLYRGAAAVCYPSRFEGFGIPVIEAMASGVPCVVSAHPSLDEASGEAAIRVDPERPEAIAAGIERALAGSDRLVTRGLRHAARFTWAGTGQTFLRGYLERAA